MALRHTRWRVALLTLSAAGSVAFAICLLDGHTRLGLQMLATVVIVLIGVLLS